jgi:myo-inositol-1(or 4)-monophosphatase
VAVAALVPEVRDVRRGGASSLDLCAVAAGWVDAYLEHGIASWDWAAGALIAAEAGAVVRVPIGHPWHDDADELGPDLCLASAPGIDAELREHLRSHGWATI